MKTLDQVLERTNRSIAQIAATGGLSIADVWAAIDHGADELDDLQRYRLRQGLTAPIEEKPLTKRLRASERITILPKYRRKAQKTNPAGLNQYGKPGNWGINRVANYLRKKQRCCKRNELFSAVNLSASAGTIAIRRLFAEGKIEKRRCECSRSGKAVCYRWVEEG